MAHGMNRFTGAVALSVIALGTSVGDAAPRVQFEKGSFIALSVANLEAAERWYIDHFGLEARSRSSYGTVKSVVLAADGLEVELIANTEARGPRLSLETGAFGIVKAGFVVADFERAVAALRQDGVQFVAGPFPPRTDQRANALVRDNEGNLIQLFGSFAPR